MTKQCCWTVTVDMMKTFDTAYCDVWVCVFFTRHMEFWWCPSFHWKSRD